MTSDVEKMARDHTCSLGEKKLINGVQYPLTYKDIRDAALFGHASRDAEVEELREKLRDAIGVIESVLKSIGTERCGCEPVSHGGHTCFAHAFLSRVRGAQSGGGDDC